MFTPHVQPKCLERVECPSKQPVGHGQRHPGPQLVEDHFPGVYETLGSILSTGLPIHLCSKQTTYKSERFENQTNKKQDSLVYT